MGWSAGDSRRQIDKRHALSRRTYRARAEKAGITYVDVWDGFVDDHGNYAQQGRISRDRRGGCAPMTVSISPTTAPRSWPTTLSMNCAGCRPAMCCRSHYRCRRNSHLRTGPPSCARPSARSFLSVRSAVASAVTSWVLQAIPRNRKPIRLRRGCPIAATRSSHRRSRRRFLLAACRYQRQRRCGWGTSPR